MLLIRTGRRVNEVLMMVFDPLVALHRQPDSPTTDDAESRDFVARMRYRQTKIESNVSNSIPVDAEVVAIIKAQQQVARDFMAAMGSPETQPRYLFMRTRINRRGNAPYSMATMHLRLECGHLTWPHFGRRSS
jgi:hypothetical protein